MQNVSSITNDQGSEFCQLEQQTLLQTVRLINKKKSSQYYWTVWRQVRRVRLLWSSLSKQQTCHHLYPGHWSPQCHLLLDLLIAFSDCVSGVSVVSCRSQSAPVTDHHTPASHHPSKLIFWAATLGLLMELWSSQTFGQCENYQMIKTILETKKYF